MEESKSEMMEKRIREYLQLSEDVDDGEEIPLEEAEGFAGKGRRFYEDFCLRGIRVNRVDPGFVSCSFKVPLRLTDREGNLANGSIATLVDEVGGAVVHVEGLPMNVSVDMSIAFLSKAKLGEELEITSRVMGEIGKYKGTIVVVRNKMTGEIIAEGRHSLFGMPAKSPMVAGMKNWSLLGGLVKRKENTIFWRFLKQKTGAPAPRTDLTAPQKIT